MLSRTYPSNHSSEVPLTRLVLKDANVSMTLINFCAQIILVSHRLVYQQPKYLNILAVFLGYSDFFDESHSTRKCRKNISC